MKDISSIEMHFVIITQSSIGNITDVKAYKQM
jgi:hypothetical protein